MRRKLQTPCYLVGVWANQCYLGGELMQTLSCNLSAISFKKFGSFWNQTKIHLLLTYGCKHIGVCKSLYLFWFIRIYLFILVSIKVYKTCFDSARLISRERYRRLVISSMSGEQQKHSFAFSVLSIDYHISDYIRHCVNHTSHLITATITVHKIYSY